MIDGLNSERLVINPTIEKQNNKRANYLKKALLESNWLKLKI